MKGERGDKGGVGWMDARRAASVRVTNEGGGRDTEASSGLSTRAVRTVKRVVEREKERRMKDEDDEQLDNDDDGTREGGEATEGRHTLL